MKFRLLDLNTDRELHVLDRDGVIPVDTYGWAEYLEPYILMLNSNFSFTDIKAYLYTYPITNGVCIGYQENGGPVDMFNIIIEA